MGRPPMTKTEYAAFTAYRKNVDGAASADKFRDHYQGTFRTAEEWAARYLVEVEGVKAKLVRFIDLDGYIDVVSNENIIILYETHTAHVFTR